MDARAGKSDLDSDTGKCLFGLLRIDNGGKVWDRVRACDSRPLIHAYVTGRGLAHTNVAELTGARGRARGSWQSRPRIARGS